MVRCVREIHVWEGMPGRAMHNRICWATLVAGKREFRKQVRFYWLPAVFTAHISIAWFKMQVLPR
jgi:hypothetical protein